MKKVTESADLNIIFNEKLIAKNTFYNLVGYGFPLILALFFIPSLIKGLGEERFGILSLAWIVIGYFSFFDFGIGRSLTKIISEKIGLNQTEQIPVLFWTSLLIMLSISLLVSIGMVLIVPSLVDIFNISKEMHQETQSTFYALAISVPIVSTTAGLRGVLEAYQKFGAVNLLRISLGIFTFLGPLLVLIITNSLFWIVIVLIFIRIIAWSLYLMLCFKINKNIKKGINFDFISIKPVLKFSIWIAVANIVGPIILYSDRFLIGTIESAKAITYYSSPYEVITKLLVIPGSVAGVLFPLFSASFISDPNISKKAFIRGVKFIFLILYPIIVFVITFSYEGMELWLGEQFAVNSSLILQFLSIGVLMNGIGLIPDIFLQGIGKPKIPTIIYIVELPIFIIAMWFSIERFGIKGAALTWMFAATLSTIILYIISNRIFNINIRSNFKLNSFLLTMIGLIIPFFLSNIFFKVVFIVISLSIFIIVAWSRFLSADERNFIISKLKFKV